MPRVEINVEAPNFTLNDFNGKSVSLLILQDKKMCHQPAEPDFSTLIIASPCA